MQLSSEFVSNNWHFLPVVCSDHHLLQDSKSVQNWRYALLVRYDSRSWRDKFHCLTLENRSFRVCCPHAVDVMKTVLTKHLIGQQETIIVWGSSEVQHHGGSRKRDGRGSIEFESTGDVLGPFRIN